MATGEYVTHEELAVALAGVATKEDLEWFATKEDLRQIDDKLEARFSGLYALIRDYLLNDEQRDDWDHRNGS